MRRQRTAGKHPMLRPSLPDTKLKTKANKKRSVAKVQKQSAEATMPKSQAKAIKKHALPWITATRRYSTRSQAKIFHLLDLPAELRNHVHHFMATIFSDGKKSPINLNTLVIPAALSLSHQLRSEALPFFFSSNTFKMSVMSEYCVFNRHFHRKGSPGYPPPGLVGKLTLSPLLTGEPLPTPRRVSADDDSSDEDYDDHEEDEDEVAPTPLQLKDEWIRFRHVIFEVECVCCEPNKCIAKVEISMDGPKPQAHCTVEVKLRTEQKKVVADLEILFGQVRALLEELGRRDGFNGFTVQDLRWIGICAAIKKRKER